NAGSHMAFLLEQVGYKIVAVSDSRHAVYSPDGIAFDRLASAKRQPGGLAGLADGAGVRSIPLDDLVAVDCDVLVPAAMENLIHADNAASVKARVVVELANGPITPEADAILDEKGIAV